MIRHALRILAAGAVLAVAAPAVLSFATGEPAPGAPEVRIVTIAGHLFAAGGSYSVNESPANDAFVAGGRVLIGGNYGEDLFAAGGDVDFGGSVAGDAMIGGGTIDLQAAIGGDLFASGGAIRQRAESTVGGSAFLAGGSVDVDGAIAGDLRVGTNRFVLNGRVGGDVEVGADHIAIGPGASIGGALRYRSGNEPTISSGASIAGGIEALAVEREGARDGRARVRASIGVGGLGSIVALTVLAALLHLVVPGVLAAAADGIGERPLPNFGWGIATVLAAPLAGVVLLLTLIGIPVAVLLWLFLALLLVAATVVAAYWVGLRVRSFTGAKLEDPEFWGRTLWTLAGFVVLAMVRWVPWVGDLAVAVLYAVALGAVLTALWHRFRGPPPVTAGI